MSNIGVEMSNYIHSYAAYRVPKDKMPDQSDMTDKGDQLVLTENAQKQLLQDRSDYAAAMMENRKIISAEQHNEAVKKYTEDQAKMLAVFRSMASGKNVSGTDEKKLMEYDPKLYMSAKMAQMMSQRAEEKKEAHFSEKDEEEYKKKMEHYHAEIDKMRDSWNAEFDKFVAAQKDAIVEIDDTDIDFSAIKSVINLGGGIKGAVVDTTL